ncbi:hypothetical protein M8J75_000698 [Diaphorina citri]|nr:hypothetical protein M8J75_000698 [Diaphorina citri]
MSANKKHPSAWRGRNFWNKSRGWAGRNGYRQQTSGATGSNNIVSPVVTPTTQSTGPYLGWQLYFYDESYKKDGPTDTKIKSCLDFIERHNHLYNVAEIEERRCYLVDIKVLMNDQIFNDQWKTFLQNLSNEPQHTINCLGLAMHHYIISEWRRELGIVGTQEFHMELRIIRARVFNFEPILQLKNFKTQHHGKLVAVRGTIIRVSNAKLLCSHLAFSCVSCQTEQVIRQDEGKHTTPGSCINTSCKSRTFIPLRCSSSTHTLQWQTVRLQEILADNQGEGGRVPRTVECELTEDLVESCVPGDIVTITGIVKKSEETALRKSSAAANMCTLFIDTDIQAEPNLFKLLVNSLCPSIFGHEMVKAGLLLALFGGCHSTNGSRGDAHVLIVGDPGLGKSQMLHACCAVAPRGVYVCGNTSTTSGLTVTLSREGGGDFALEAGALVLADQGVCCIDEFDKMSAQHQALLEAMEQQSISIAKASVVCSLPARTSVIAAANPVGGHYNRAKTVAENLRMGQALLSRFDLVFILLDNPDEHLDTLLSEHVMASLSGFQSNRNPSHSTQSFTENPNSVQSDIPLSERLKPGPGEELPLIPAPLLHKYLAYARKYVSKPELSTEAALLLQEFYLNLRKHHHSVDATPVTTRQLESLVRLTQARAKCELREEASKQDAQDVIDIMKWSLIDTSLNGGGGIDFTRSQHGSGFSSKSNAKKFISVLQKKAEVQSRSVFTVTELKQLATSANISVDNFFTFLTSLNDQGFLLKKGKQLYQLMSVDY